MAVKIAVDAMGSDKGPASVIEGALKAVNKYNISVIIVGDEKIIKSELDKERFPAQLVEVKASTQVIGMDESPATACRQKKDASIMVATQLVMEGKADAVVSAGNTGAAMTAALLTLGRLEEVFRPAIAVLIPSTKGQSVLLDVGANVDCKPKHLLQFAIMGSVYAEYMLKKNKPRVGLLSIGEEETKGNELVLGTRELLKRTSLNFIGNVEGRDIVSDKADVVVCDGFIGNIILKFGETIFEKFYAGLKNEFNGRSIFRHLGALLVKPVIKDFFKRTDRSERGGAPLLGTKEVCFISHGSSSEKAIMNAIRSAADYVSQKVNEHIEDRLKEYKNMLAGLTGEEN